MNRSTRTLRNRALTAGALVLAATVNGPVVSDAATSVLHDYQVSRPDYMAKYGSWDTVELPEEYRARAIHAALLYTGKVLLVAGSGNSQEHFDAGTFETVLWDPATGESKHIATPEDLFCGGHAYLPNGNLLIAGGTDKYEVLGEDVKSAAGPMVIKNESDVEPVSLPAGTQFVSDGGQVYESAEDVVVPAAHKMADDSLMAGEADVWVSAVEEGEGSVATEGAQYAIEGLADEQAAQVYGVADALTLDKQNYQGLDSSYIFDVQTEEYVETGRLDVPRWYPTLVSVNGGNVLAVSGLDEHGSIIDGNNEMFEISKNKWYDKPELNRYFPTYPHLFRLEDGRLFYSGANTGYGSATEGRKPGIWDLTDNSFQPVNGLRDPEMNETATSFLLPPVQDQKVAIVGGGEVGDGPDSTARFDVVDTDAPSPRWRAVQDYPRAARYISAVTLPDDKVLLTGGSTGYRGAGDSDLHLSRLYDPQDGSLDMAADNEVGRNYHSTALLLPDGRVMTMGSDPLYGDAENTTPGTFDTRIEIFTPPYLHTGTDRPEVTAVEESTESVRVRRGTTFQVDAEVRSGGKIVAARLLRPSAVTHQTDTEQRSVRLDITERANGGYDLSLDKLEGVTPDGPYMLVLVDDLGVPSVGRWVQVG
jgi:hypothetical protein